MSQLTKTEAEFKKDLVLTRILKEDDYLITETDTYKYLKISDKVEYLLNTDTNDEFFMDSPYTGHYDPSGKEKKIKSHVKRHEVKILTLRDAFMFVLDPKFLVIRRELKIQPIIYERYYMNRLTYTGL